MSRGMLTWQYDIIRQNGDPTYASLGIVTLEDVIETLIQTEIMDEKDIGSNRHYDGLEAIVTLKRRRHEMDDNQIKAIVPFLKNNVSAFSTIADRVLYKLVREAMHVTSATDVLYERGKPSSVFTLVLHGKVKVTSGAYV